MAYVTVDIVYSQAIPDLFTPGITTSTCCEGDEFLPCFVRHAANESPQIIWTV